MKKNIMKMFCWAAVSMAALPLHADFFGDSCNDSCYDFCGGCDDRFWATADYLYWQVQDSPEVIPLVIAQPIADGPFDVVLGGKKIKDDWHSGGNFRLGYWFDDCKNWGAEVGYFFLGNNSKHSSVASDENGVPRLRVPFFDVTTGLPDSTALATPGLFRGRASLKVSNEMQGAELNLVKDLPWNCASNFKAFAGFRYWNFEENLTFFVDSPLVAFPTVYNYRDKFDTQNNFYGGQIGVMFSQCYESFFLNVRGKVALGAMCQELKIDGRFETNEFTGTVETFPGGYFALPTNMGSHKKTCFSVIPEINLDIGYRVSDQFSLHVGYSFLYATNVLRASKQMSSAINPTQSANIDFTPTPALVGVPSPLAKLKSSSLWVQGVNVGVDFKF